MARRQIGLTGMRALIIAAVLVMQFSRAVAAPAELSLEDSIAAALNNNPVTKLAQDDKAISAWDLAAAKAGFGPTLTFNHTDTDTNRNPFDLSGSSWNFITNAFHFTSLGTPNTLTSDNDLRISLPVYSGGKVESQYKQAKLNLHVADMEVNKTTQQLKLDTTTAYFNVLQARNLLQVRRESEDNLMAHLKSVQIQYDSGAVNKADVLRSEVELGNSRQDLIKAQNQYDVTMVRFKKLLGLPRTGQVSLKDNLGYEEFPYTLEDCLRSAAEHRPDLAQVKAGVHIAAAGIESAKSQNLPQVSFNGDLDWNDSHFPGLRNGNWTVSLLASIDVFDSGLTRAKVKASEIGLAKAQQKVTQAEDAMVEEVSVAFLNLREAQKRIEVSRTVVNQAEEDYKIAGIRYEEGAGTNLDVIDAQLALAQAKANYVQAMYDYNVNRAVLKKAMGVL
jgi:outer membrane protein